MGFLHFFGLQFFVCVLLQSNFVFLSKYIAKKPQNACVPVFRLLFQSISPVLGTLRKTLTIRSLK